jgi:hypothetical protein
MPSGVKGLKHAPRLYGEHLHDNRLLLASTALQRNS